jgi:hypothetical protein
LKIELSGKYIYLDLIQIRIVELFKIWLVMVEKRGSGLVGWVENRM